MDDAPDFPFRQIATGDLDIAVISQQPPNLPLGDEFEPGPVKMVGSEAPFGCSGPWKQDLENAPGKTHHTLILADPDAEFDNGAAGIQRASGGNGKT